MPQSSTYQRRNTVQSNGSGFASIELAHGNLRELVDMVSIIGFDGKLSKTRDALGHIQETALTRLLAGLSHFIGCI